MVDTAMILMLVYRLLALIVAVMMVIVLWRERDWRARG